MSDKMVFQVKKCSQHDPFRDPNDPPCASDVEINNFVKYLSIETWVI